MKTLKQWYNERSDEAKKYLNSFKWIDTSTADYYRKPELDLSTLSELVKDEDGKYAMYTSDRIEAISLITLQYLVREGKVDAQILADHVQKNRLYCEKCLYKFMPLEVVRDCIRMNAKRNSSFYDEKTAQYDLHDLLLLTEDFDNIDWSLLRDNYPLDAAMLNILDHDLVIQKAKENPMSINISRTPMNNDLVDELFFGENGLTEEQKHRVITGYCRDLSDVEDFMKRFVTVDESYLKYLGRIIEDRPDLAMKLYKQKKPDEELAEYGEHVKIADSYRYPKEYRKLFLIAGCCARENVGKAKAGLIGEIASLLKMYSWNYLDIFYCLYPQHAEATTTTEETN